MSKVLKQCKPLYMHRRVWSLVEIQRSRLLRTRLLYFCRIDPYLMAPNGQQIHRRSTTGLFFFFFFFFAFSPVWRPLRYVHAIILPLKPFLSILNQPSSMGYYIDKVGNAVSQFNWGHGIPRISNSYFTLYRYFNAGCQYMSVFVKDLDHCLHSK